VHTRRAGDLPLLWALKKGAAALKAAKDAASYGSTSRHGTELSQSSCTMMSQCRRRNLFKILASYHLPLADQSQVAIAARLFTNKLPWTKFDSSSSRPVETLLLAHTGSCNWHIRSQMQFQRRLTKKPMI